MKRQQLMVFALALTMIAGMLSSEIVIAQDAKFDAQIRYRGESVNRKGSFEGVDFSNSNANNNFSNLRSRFGVTLTGERNVSAYFQVQDSRRFGEEFSTFGDASADQFDLHQGYIMVTDVLERAIDLKIGRMEFSLGNQRMVGSFDWSNTGRSFDGILLSHDGDVHASNYFAFKLNDNAPFSDFDPDEYFAGIHYTYKHSEDRKLSLYGFYNINSERIASGPDVGERKLSKLTPGFDYSAKRWGFNYQIEGAGEFGTEESRGQFSRELDLNGYFLAASIKHVWDDEERQPYFGLTFDWHSGDDEPNDSKQSAFSQTIFGTNHGFYGYMDYFTDVRTATQGLGLMSYGIQAGTKFNDSARLDLQGFVFAYAEDGPSEDSYLGSEIDLTLQYNYSSNLALQLGGSLFVPGDVPKGQLVNATDKSGVWFYSMLTYTFRQD